MDDCLRTVAAHVSTHLPLSAHASTRSHINRVQLIPNIQTNKTSEKKHRHLVLVSGGGGKGVLKEAVKSFLPPSLGWSRCYWMVGLCRASRCPAAWLWWLLVFKHWPRSTNNKTKQMLIFSAGKLLIYFGKHMCIVLLLHCRWRLFNSHYSNCFNCGQISGPQTKDLDGAVPATNPVIYLPSAWHIIFWTIAIFSLI